MAALFLFDAYEGHVPRAPLVALIPIFGVIAAVFYRVGRPPADAAVVDGLPGFWNAQPGESPYLAPRYTIPAALAVALVGALTLGYPSFEWVAVASLVVLLPSAVRRPGLLLFVVVSAAYLPRLGGYGLWDPWETHYGEVSREILARKDWISLWWAQEYWFWSKPILIFWMEATSMASLGVNFLPDANPENAEWALRLPHYLLSMGAVMSVFALVRRTFSVRAGFLAGLALATIPHFFFLAHQAITDMPFVSTMTIAMCLLALALVTDRDATVTSYRVGRFAFSAQHVVLAALIAVVLPQAIYLLSRNVTLTEGFRFAFHPDAFLYGSAGNGSDVPGNPAPREHEAAVGGWAFQPITQGFVWLLGLAVLVWMYRRERRTRALLLLGFYLFCGLAFMAKGIPGFALPGLVALFHLVATRKWKMLGDGELRVARGMLTVAVVGMPWYVAMYMRHGRRFTDRLLIHDHINRLTAGVHGDKGTVQYFLEQLGYGMFPWIALVPVGVAIALVWRRRSDTRVAERETLTLFTLWFFAAFTLFSAMVTKFHHYIFPAEPPAAILAAIALDRLLGAWATGWRGKLGVVLAAGFGVALPFALGAFVGNLRGVIPEAVEAANRADWARQHAESAGVAGALVVVALALLVGAAWLLRTRRADGEKAADPAVHTPAFAVAILMGASVLAFVGRDLAWRTDARPAGYERLIHLFVYNYQRAWPEQFDYRAALTGFACAATLVLVLFAVPRLRAIFGPAFLGVAFAFTFWTVNIYLVDLSPHWGQRELIKEYYELRKGPSEPLLAYQMNWKGENFYTGNHAFVFVKLDTKQLKDWITDHPGQHAYALLEHSRVGSFRGHVRGGEVKEVTTKRDNNKFVLLSVTLPGREKDEQIQSN